MQLEIVTPEAVIFKSEVDAVTVPGVNGSFQMLKDHAPIVSLLDAGVVKIQGDNITMMKEYQSLFEEHKGEYTISIKGGTIEMNHNKIIVLAD